MKTLQIKSQVGSDGILTLRVPIGADEAASDVLVTIEPLNETLNRKSDRTDWHQFVEETYGSCASLGLERPDQGELEDRDPIE